MILQLHIDKLRGLDNYKPRSMAVRAYLETEDLWDAVEHCVHKISESKRRGKCAKFIIFLIEQKLCQFMASARTANNMWIYLKNNDSLTSLNYNPLL